MSRSLHGGLAFVAIVMLAACSSNASNPMLPGSSPSQPAAVTGGMTGAAAISGTYVPPPAGPWALTRLCAAPANPRDRRCEAIVRNDIAAVEHPSYVPGGFSPADLQSAYGLGAASASGGYNQTVAIVDAYDDPKAESDLGVYRSTYGLPPCTTANGCFRKVNQNGLASPLPSKDANWAGEESLDLDMVSAICPHCHILFVEANNAGPALDVAVNTAARLKANVISNSYGGPEYAKSDSAFVHPGIVITAAAGDDNYFDCNPYPGYPSCTGPEQPASFANVVAVGGTHLVKGGARGWSESVWNDDLVYHNHKGGTGSGCSRMVPKPSWQTDKGCTMRSETDVSAVADPYTAVAAYDTYPSGGWYLFGGTSVSSPLIAGVFALAGNSASVAQPAGLWSHKGAYLNDVTAGNNLVPVSIYPPAGKYVCPASWLYICYAGAGYDGPTGWGTPSGIKAF
ncbi:MAG TPA: S53 family peptidase [Candidatus Acidoferrales bacterium]|nr:S53 family peptidase [Candidatus Acidoferrales bacterium]